MGLSIPNYPVVNDTWRANHLDGFRGYVGRDLEKIPRGSLKCAPMATFPVYDKQEILDRINGAIADGTSIPDVCDVAGLPVKNQKSTNYCHVADTEVLTEKGWVSWPDYNWRDSLGTMNPLTGLLEFQPCLKKHIYEHQGQVIYSTNRSVNFGVTEDHRMLVRKWDESQRKLSKQLTFQRAGELGWYFGLPSHTSGHLGTEVLRVAIPGDREYGGDDFASLISLIVSDGFAGSADKSKNLVSFCRFKGPTQEIDALARRCGFTQQPGRPGVWNRWNAGALAEWIRSQCYSGSPYRSWTKRVPPIVKEMSSRQIRHFLAYYGDQSHTMKEGGAYFSTSEKCIDDLQELLLRVGIRGSKWSADNQGRVATLENGQVCTSRRRLYHLHARASSELSILRKQYLERDSYNGLVYCATVPNGTLVTRREGTILISGNCWINASTHTMEIVRVLQGQKAQVLSAGMAGSLITGYSNRGGSASEGFPFLAEKGTCLDSLWPNAQIGRPQDMAACVADALNHAITNFVELDPSNHAQIATAILNGMPVSVGIPAWGHEVTLTWLLAKASSYAPWTYIFDNSWGTSWGNNGRGTIDGVYGRFDEAFSPWTVTPSTN